MRDTVIGVALAALFLGGLFGLNYFDPHVSGTDQAASDVKPGFTGQTVIGPWQLVCAPAPSGAAVTPNAAIPFSLNPNPRTAAANLAQARCRITTIERRKDNPKAILLVAILRQTGPNLALIMLIPPLAKDGDTVVMRLGRAGLKLPVGNCDKGKCIVRGVLGAEARTLLLSAPQAMLVFPAVRDGKPLGLIVPLDGLNTAVDAMKRAES